MYRTPRIYTRVPDEQKAVIIYLHVERKQSSDCKVACLETDDQTLNLSDCKRSHSPTTRELNRPVESHHRR